MQFLSRGIIKLYLITELLAFGGTVRFIGKVSPILFSGILTGYCNTTADGRCLFEAGPFLTQFLYQAAICTYPENPSNRRLYEHEICIRHCRGLNSQPVRSRVCADLNRAQGRTSLWPSGQVITLLPPEVILCSLSDYRGI